MAAAADAVTKPIDAALEDAGRWLTARLPEAKPMSGALFVLGFACTKPSDEGVLGALAQALPTQESNSSNVVLRAAVSTLPCSSPTRAYLLSLLGDAAPVPPLTWLGALDDDRLRYVAPAALVRQIATSIALVTNFGTLSRDWPLSLKDALAFWAFCAMRDEDLDLLCPIVRALLFLGRPRPEECDDAIEFILRHQRQDGRFSAQELSLLQCSRITPSFDYLKDAYLPTTVGSVWTLKEANARA